MAKKRCTGKALAERRRRAMRLHLAEFSQEEIAGIVLAHVEAASAAFAAKRY